MPNDLYYLLETSTSILGEIRYKTCCKDVRDNALTFALSDLFEDLNIEYDSNTMKKNPLIYYVYFRDHYIPNSNLSPHQKNKLLKNLNNMK
jgi:hypothetical protein